MLHVKNESMFVWTHWKRLKSSQPWFPQQTATNFLGLKSKALDDGVPLALHPKAAT
jgi:hypothetical protein